MTERRVELQERRQSWVRLQLPILTEIYSPEHLPSIVEYLANRQRKEAKIGAIRESSAQGLQRDEEISRAVSLAGGRYQDNRGLDRLIADNRKIDALQDEISGMDKLWRSIVTDGVREYLEKLLELNKQRFAIRKPTRDYTEALVLNPRLKASLPDGELKLSVSTNRKVFFFSSFNPSVSWTIGLQNGGELRLAQKVVMSYVFSTGRPEKVDLPITLLPREREEQQANLFRIGSAIILHSQPSS